MVKQDAVLSWIRQYFMANAIHSITNYPSLPSGKLVVDINGFSFVAYLDNGKVEYRLMDAKVTLDGTKTMGSPSDE